MNLNLWEEHPVPETWVCVSVGVHLVWSVVGLRVPRSRSGILPGTWTEG